MVVKNKTKNTILTKKLKEAKTWREKVFGLIGKKEPTAILIKTRFGIHSFGVRFPFDVLVIKHNGTVVSKKQSMQPNSLFFWPPKYDSVLELPAGCLEDSKTEIGDEIELVA